MLQIKDLCQKVLLLTALIVATTSCYKDSEGSFSNDKSPGGGKGGSLARFTVTCNHLYVVDNQSLHVMNIADPENPVSVKKIDIGFGIETIFPFGDYLLIGSNTGMFIYSIANDCSNPTYVSQFAHVLSCDPVVAQGNYAYVTLRSGGDCRIGFTANQLDIINISNIQQPVLWKSHEMTEPWGLGIDGSALFVCHGEYGLGVYDVSDPLQLDTIHFFPSVKSYDVIPDNNVLMVTGPGGIYQYDYSDIHQLTLLSTIPVP